MADIKETSAEATNGLGAQVEATPATGECSDLATALAEAERARDEYLDALRRLQAEFENYRKRARRELAEAQDAARASVLKDLLPVLDNLDRALNAAEHHEEGKVLEGVRLTRALFAELLRKAGVRELDPKGEAFDPSVHEAMMAVPSSEPEGTVLEVFEKGYLLGDRVLRPARVAVATGGGDESGADLEQSAEGACAE